MSLVHHVILGISIFLISYIFSYLKLEIALAISVLFYDKY